MARAAKKERKWKSLSKAVVINGRKKLYSLEAKGEGRGFISEFARKHDISNVTAFLALRGKTYRYLPMPASATAKRGKRKTA